MIKINDWKEFKLSDYFEIEAGKYHYPDEYAEGRTPYVSASNENNGISQYIDLEPDFDGNKIVTGKVGCTAFYEPLPFCATSDVNIFTPKFKMSPKIGLFITTIINFSENYKWAYGRQCRVGNSKRISVFLPSNNVGEPDWQYMEEFMGGLQTKPLATSVKSSNIALKTDEWKEFEIRDIFDIKYGINMELNDCIISDDDKAINFVSRTEDNNGVSARVELVEGKVPQESGLITCAGGGSVLSTFLQEKPFYSGRDLYLLKAKDNISRLAKLFIITIIKKNKYKYNYGRQANITLPYLKLKLPATKEGKPDYTFMENYIKNLPYSDCL